MVVVVVKGVPVSVPLACKCSVVVVGAVVVVVLVVGASVEVVGTSVVGVVVVVDAVVITRNNDMIGYFNLYVKPFTNLSEKKIFEYMQHYAN